MSDSIKQNVQWFPGHMAKTRRLIKECLPSVDAVTEILDARMPISSSNPELNELIGNKPLIVLLNKCDVADETLLGVGSITLMKKAFMRLPLTVKAVTDLINTHLFCERF